MLKSPTATRGCRSNSTDSRRCAGRDATELRGTHSEHRLGHLNEIDRDQDAWITSSRQHLCVSREPSCYASTSAKATSHGPRSPASGVSKGASFTAVKPSRTAASAVAATSRGVRPPGARLMLAYNSTDSGGSSPVSSLRRVRPRAAGGAVQAGLLDASAHGARGERAGFPAVFGQFTEYGGQRAGVRALAVSPGAVRAGDAQHQPLGTGAHRDPEEVPALVGGHDATS